MTETVPIDRSREFREYDYPRTPGVYTPSTHFGQRVKLDSRRHLTGEVINSCITDGEIRDNGDGTACFVEDWHGVKYFLIAGFHYSGYRLVATAWPHVADRKRAIESGRWNSDELDEIIEYQKEKAESFEYKYPAYDKWLKEQWQ